MLNRVNGVTSTAASAVGFLCHMAQSCRFAILMVVLPFFLTHSTCAASPVDSISLQNFKLKLGTESITVLLDTPNSGIFQDEDMTGESHSPIELGVQLRSHGIDLNSAKDLGGNKIGFGGVNLQLENSEEERCMEVTWTTSENITLEDCFPLSNNNWYGGPEQNNQYWPIEESTFNENAYVTTFKNDQAIAESYWLNSIGLMIYVDPTVPLFIDQNHHRNNSLCLLAKHTAPYLRKGGSTLKYTVCKFDNPRAAHEYAIEKFLGKPSDIPDVLMVKHPIWSTWAKYKININEDVIMTYAKEIVDHGFNNSQLEIDDLWETCYGSLKFNKTTFPNIKRLVSQLNKMGFRTTIWVHPFINLDCDMHKEAVTKKFFVQNTLGDIKTSWWNGEASCIDFTNQDAANWYEDRLRKMLEESGIDSLKFDAGESGWSPQVPILKGHELEHPGIIVRKYLELAAKFGPMIEVRTAKRTQNLPIFVRMNDRESLWGFKTRGMSSVITATFQMNLNGYPFVLPDMVGGNAYNDGIITKEMFIRYLQLNVFLPTIQFSIPPWDYDSETVALSKKLTSLHYEYSDTIIELMKKAVKTGQPINPPIWWVDPTNKEAHKISSEYLLGEDILVAPVLEEGASSRDIYLPKGQWRDEAKPDKPLLTGPLWLRNYPAPLDTLPYFTRIASSGADRLSFPILLCLVITCILTIFP